MPEFLDNGVFDITYHSVNFNHSYAVNSKIIETNSKSWFQKSVIPRDVVRTRLDISDEAFCKISERLKGVNYFHKSSILYVWQSFEYGSDLGFIFHFTLIPIFRGRRSQEFHEMAAIKKIRQFLLRTNSILRYFTVKSVESFGKALLQNTYWRRLLSLSGLCLSWSPELNLYRSSHPDVLCKEVVQKNFAILTGKHLCWNLFLIKLQVLYRNQSFDLSCKSNYWFLYKACKFIKKRLQHRCFPENIAKYLKTAFL